MRAKDSVSITQSAVVADGPAHWAWLEDAAVSAGGAVHPRRPKQTSRRGDMAAAYRLVRAHVGSFFLNKPSAWYI